MIVLVLSATAALCLVMIAGWAWQRARGNGGWTDVFWTFGTGACGVAVALWPLHGEPPTLRQLLAAALAAAWSLRLGLHIAQRVARSPEDARYTLLRAEWGADFQRRMALFLPSQAIVSIPLLVSVMLAARNPAPGLGITDAAGAALLAAAVLGEGVADRQLDSFKADPASKGRICDVGLWGWSRHPNYFFEWLGWLALGGPAAMYAILNYATGLPPLEAHMLRSRGAAFRAYQRRTSAFFPLPPGRRGA